MKKFLTISLAAFAMANAVFAQSEQQASFISSKEAAKVKKAQDAADLKAFKAKQQAELSAFIEAQKKGLQPMRIEKPVMVTPDDSLAYLFGIAQSNGLENYVTSQKKVEKEFLNTFTEALLSRASGKPEDKEASARSAGTEIADQIVTMTQQFSNDYYDGEKGKSIDAKIVAAGIVAGMLGQSEISVDSANSVFQKTMIAHQNARYVMIREEGEKFLAENKTKPGVVTTESGLQYKVITMGTGEKPVRGKKVVVDYEGRLINGTVFDSSYQRGEPAIFEVDQVISGWTEALMLMPVGSKWELYIPYQLGYGERGAGSNIKPYSALIFTVELKGIE